MKTEYRILALGDIVGAEATDKVCRVLNGLRRELAVDFAVANGENAAAGNGLDRASAERLLHSGVDVLTSGNHIWQKKEIEEYIEENPFVLRPANYPTGTPGRGCAIFESGGVRLLVMNVLGTVFLDPLSDPFDAVEAMLEENRGSYDFSVLDIHAEATSEKLALARFFDGRISAVFGTHTHILTADTRILPGGTGYLTDLGMCGPEDSILGVKSECVIRKLRTHRPVRFENPSGPVELNGAVFTLDRESGRAVRVEILRRILS